MDDLISRQDAVDAINKAFERVFAWTGTSPLGDKVLENVPSAQPEQRWIPCSERLPKKGRYLVIGKKNRDWYESDKIVTSAFYDGEFWTDNGDIQAEAWMPLPEPYKGE